MPKLYFRYGAMGASKTMNMLAVAHNYESQGKKVLVLKPAIDTRFGSLDIKSRAGLERKADFLIHTHADILKLSLNGVACIVLDECQFVEASVIDALRKIATEQVPVICYGLRTDFMTHFFPGSKRLMEVADTIEEIKTTCVLCNRKAIFNLRHKNGEKVAAGSQIELGVEDKYAPVCHQHYMNFSSPIVALTIQTIHDEKSTSK